MEYSRRLNRKRDGTEEEKGVGSGMWTLETWQYLGWGSLMCPCSQQPPQLFPQLLPSDPHWPLTAATPQRENWSRHMSATEREKCYRFCPSQRWIQNWTGVCVSLVGTAGCASYTRTPHLLAALHAHTQSWHTPPCWSHTPFASWGERNGVTVWYWTLYKSTVNTLMVKTKVQ